MYEKAPPSAGEVRALANQLLAWADSLARPKQPEGLSEESQEERMIALATASLEARRLRARIFPELSVNEPVWDVLLDLFVKEANGYRVSFEHLARDSGLPLQTFETAMAALSKAGLVGRVPGGLDPQQLRIALTDVGREKMTALMQDTAGLMVAKSEDQALPLAQTA